MNRSIRYVTGFLGVMLAASAVTAVAQDVPPIRDSRTGRIWTPDVVTEEASAPNSPNAYVDRAFNPRAQDARVEGVVVQHPHANLMGTVPFTAGPSVPVAVIDAPSLQVIPGRHWLSILYLTNNSDMTVNAIIGCRFTNNGQSVEDTRVILPPAGPGERIGAPVLGPRYDVFVDKVTCQLMSPA